MHAVDSGGKRRIRGKGRSGFAEGRVKSGLSLCSILALWPEPRGEADTSKPAYSTASLDEVGACYIPFLISLAFRLNVNGIFLSKNGK
jgi:hypothetical protein